MESARSVLVVDDDPSMRDMLASLLHEEGIAVECVSSVEAALAAVYSTAFDVVLSDIHLPKVDGFELLRELRKRQEDAPVIMMTSFGSTEIITQVLQAGAFDYLAKPFTRAQLRAALERAFAG
jgi:DNA-binding response OmpR family regulator